MTGPPLHTRSARLAASLRGGCVLVRLGVDGGRRVVLGGGTESAVQVVVAFSLLLAGQCVTDARFRRRPTVVPLDSGSAV
jgi:hypothetical protein